ncbi:MAG: mevalonate kinase [archaeon]
MRACAKIILFGEHVVVYGRPAIAVPIKELFTEVNLEDSDSTNFETNLQLDVSEEQKLNLLISFIKIRLCIKNNFRVIISSNIPVKSGFGSSASLSVALIRTFSEKLNLNLPIEQINTLAFEAEKIFHGTPSGIDNTVISYERTIFFRDKVAELIPMHKALNLIIANSGPRPSTKEVVAELREMYSNNKEKYEQIYDKIEKITSQAKQALTNGELTLLGKLMNENHKALQMLELSSEKLDVMCSDVIKAGAFGAKLSGSGRGGNMIALVGNSTINAVTDALSKYSDSISRVAIQ